MGKQKRRKVSFIVEKKEGEKYKIEDAGHNSKAFVPLQVDAGNSVEVVQVDGGLITGVPKGKFICDNLVYTVKDEYKHLNITWMIELKGTKNEKEAKHTIEQILQSIQYMQDQISYPQAAKYITNRDFVFAAVAGAPDKTFPVLNNDDVKTLCRKLIALSKRRKEINDMFKLFCYIRPNRRYKKAGIQGNKAPYDIFCYSNKDGFIPYPSMLMELLR